jgi:hypothetical protein
VQTPADTMLRQSDAGQVIGRVNSRHVQISAQSIRGPACQFAGG